MFGVTKFSDWTEDEFKKLLRFSETKSDVEYDVFESDEEIEGDWDWRVQNKVGPVKDQGSCGSCWAFASTAVHESAHAIRHGGPILSLAEQELVDCAKLNFGCDGGWYVNAWAYVI